MKKRQTLQRKGNKAKLEAKNDVPTKSEPTNDNLSCEKSAVAKHEITPLKTMNKTSKQDEGNDVHTIVHSPISCSLRLSKSKNKSPLANATYSHYLGVSSQELPEVVWDYTSPKNNKRLQKPENTTTINDLLKNIQSESQDSNALPSSSNQLLEKWMNCKKKSPGVAKETERYHLRHLKKRLLKREMKAIFASFSEQGNVKPNCGMADGIPIESNEDDQNSNCPQSSTMESYPFFGEDSNSYQSDEDLWGEDSLTDNVLMVNASQQVENRLTTSVAKNAMQVPPSSIQPLCAATVVNSLESVSFDNAMSKCKPHQKCESSSKSVELTSRNKTFPPNEDIKNFENIEFNDTWEWNDDDSFLRDHELDSIVAHSDMESVIDENKDELPVLKSKTLKNEISKVQKQCKVTSTKSEQPRSSAVVDSAFNQDLFLTDINDDIFDDESEISTWLEQVETLEALSQPKYSAEEIARKKDEALKRLKENKKKK